jgi:hypothetical protein
VGHGDAAIKMKLHEPGRVLPWFKDLSESRVTVTARDDGGADFEAESDCTDAEAARAFEEVIRRQMSSAQAMLLRLATRGFSSDMTVSAEGSQVRIHAPATREQLEGMLNYLRVRFDVK